MFYHPSWNHQDSHIANWCHSRTFRNNMVLWQYSQHHSMLGHRDTCILDTTYSILCLQNSSLFFRRSFHWTRIQFHRDMPELLCSRLVHQHKANNMFHWSCIHHHICNLFHSISVHRYIQFIGICRFLKCFHQHKHIHLLHHSGMSHLYIFFFWHRMFHSILFLLGIRI